MRYFVLAVCLSLLACSGDKTSPPAQDQGAGDGVVATTDGPVSGTEGGPGDGSLSPDASAPMTDRSEGEITSGAARSSGGNYVLYSQIGHAVRPVVLSGGSYSLRCNAAVIPW